MAAEHLVIHEALLPMKKEGCLPHDVAGWIAGPKTLVAPAGEALDLRWMEALLGIARPFSQDIESVESYSMISWGVNCIMFHCWAAIACALPACCRAA